MKLINVSKKPHWNLILGQNSHVFPEAVIENLSNKSERIQIGDNTYVRGKLITYPHAGSIKVGDWCYIGARSEIYSMDSVTIGNRVLISEDVKINDNTGHSMDPRERHEHFKDIVTKGHPKNWAELPGVKSIPIIIEDDVWINYNVTIMKGVQIGARSVIAAGSIVLHDIPPDSFYRCEVIPKVSSLKENNKESVS